MRYIYGPVNSRRLGLSLGVSLTPHKICSFNCVYCQLGRTSELTLERREYIPIQEIIAELHSWLIHNSDQAKGLNYISLSGSGEPTLNINIGELIAEIKKMTTVPIAVITNASLLHLPEVRKGLLKADLVVPSLDALTPGILQKIDRPAPGIKIEEITQGLLDFKREFRGQLWLEIMVVKGLNDGLEEMRRLKEVIARLNPDKIQLNSPVRTTAEPDVEAVEKNKLKKSKRS